MVKCKRTSISPVMLGPTLIYYQKSFATYLFLASAMIGQCKEIEKLHVFGMDGEKALVDAFTHEFPFALYLTCFLHVRGNIKDELATTDFTQEKRSEILDNIFGKELVLLFMKVWLILRMKRNLKISWMLYYVNERKTKMTIF